MKKQIIKVFCFLLLIPVLGIGLPFGGAYVYGKIRYAEKRSEVVSILNRCEDELFQIVTEGRTDVPEGFAMVTHWERDCFFDLPYSSGLGNWVPCGLLYCVDPSSLEPWQKISPIRDNWYFFYEPS